MGPTTAGKAPGRFEFGNRRSLAATVGHAINHVMNSWRKQDDAVAVPSAAASKGSIAEILHDSAHGVDLLQLAIREEPNESAVGRPEGIGSVVGARQGNS